MEFSELLQALLNPAVYPDRPQRIDLVQTHISAIFLTGNYVYKIKKPVNFGFLDFTTLEKRRFYCQQEVELNRRLSPEIYLGVIEIRSHQGQIFLRNGQGDVIEYAVLMKQLPPDCTMDRLLARGALTPDVVVKTADKIAHFHARAATNPQISAYGAMGTVRGNLEENFAQTEKYVGTALSPGLFRDIQDHNRRFLEENVSLLEKRVASGKIRDCHGDLHLQHICLSREILIFDCIEFNERFRFSDVAADIAFLLMDLDFHKAPLISADLAFFYLKISRDWPIYLLLNFYKSYRAYVRGKVTCFRLDDPVISAQEKSVAFEEARSYFRLSHHYACKLNCPTLVVFSGLMGTGKSTMARILSEALGWEWLRSDVFRKELAKIPSAEHRYEEFQQGIYSPDFTSRTYEALFERALELLRSGGSVVLDGSFRTQRDRQEALEVARSAGADFLLVECRCSEPEIQRRLTSRAGNAGEPSDGRWEIFHDQKRNYEKVEGFLPVHYLALNTEVPPEEALGHIFHHLLWNAGQEVMDQGASQGEEIEKR